LVGLRRNDGPDPGSGSGKAEMILLMVEEPGCIWCARWNEDVGGEYPITPEGRAAPLVRPRSRPAPEGSPRLPPALHAHLHRGAGRAEIGRIEGYPGEDFFWGLLGRILEKGRPMVEQPVRKAWPVTLSPRMVLPLAFSRCIGA
jgi:hypothetical protein